MVLERGGVEGKDSKGRAFVNSHVPLPRSLIISPAASPASTDREDDRSQPRFDLIVDMSKSTDLALPWISTGEHFRVVEHCQAKDVSHLRVGLTGN